MQLNSLNYRAEGQGGQLELGKTQWQLKTLEPEWLAEGPRLHGPKTQPTFLEGSSFTNRILIVL